MVSAAPYSPAAVFFMISGILFPPRVICHFYQRAGYHTFGMFALQSDGLSQNAANTLPPM